MKDLAKLLTILADPKKAERFIQQIEGTTAAMREQAEKLKTLQDNAKQLEAAHNQRQAELDARENKLMARELAFDTDLSNLESQRAERIAEVNELTRQAGEARKRVDVLDAEETAMEIRVASLSEQISETQAEYDALTRKLDAKRKILSQLADA